MHTIGEVCKLLGIKPHILRYWEREIPLLSPKKNIAGRRIYSQRDIQILSRLKYLLYEKKYTVQGAREKIWEELQGGNPNLLSSITQIRSELLGLVYKINQTKVKPMDREALIRLYKDRGHGHLFVHWDERDRQHQERLIEDLAGLDVSVLDTIQVQLKDARPVPPQFVPAPYVPAEGREGTGDITKVGERLVREGKTAFLTVAGGQGSRLGFEGPKGMYPISPLRRVTLFQIFAERLLAAQMKYQAQMPWYIMTSPQNDRQTKDYFEQNSYFGLERKNVTFFKQGTIPTFDDEGKLLLAQDGGLLCNPDGHGGLLRALRSHGLIKNMQARGVEEIFYFQVDNPLVNVPDLLFLGTHRKEKSEVSSKVIRKLFPEEKLGSIVLFDGKTGIVEYSDLDKERMYAKDEKGNLLYSHGSIAIHLFNVGFLSNEALRLPFHVARKKVKTLIYKGGKSEIVEKDGIKLEMFIFDILPQVQNGLFYETVREEEFSPLKNKTGIDSVPTCIAGQIAKAAGQIEACGVKVPRDQKGVPIHRLEISPLFALDLEDLRKKLSGGKIRIDEDKLFI